MFPTYRQVFDYAGQIEQTGSYSRAEMEAILAARYLYGQDWLAQLQAQGPAALAALQKPTDILEDLLLRLRRLNFLLHCLFRWLMGDEFDEAHMIIRDVLENLYPEESHLRPHFLAKIPWRDSLLFKRRVMGQRHFASRERPDTPARRS